MLHHHFEFLTLTKRSHQSRKAKERDAKQIVHQVLASFSCGGFKCDAVSFYKIVNLSISRIAFANQLATVRYSLFVVSLIRECDCLGARYAGGDEMPSIMHNVTVTKKRMKEFSNITCCVDANSHRYPAVKAARVGYHTLSS